MPLRLTKSSLSRRRRQFVELLQSLNFGRLESLRIERGEPVTEPRPRTVFDFKFPGDNGPRAELAIEDFVLKPQVIEVLQHFERIGDGTIDLIEVRNGLPCRMLFTAA